MRSLEPCHRTFYLGSAEPAAHTHDPRTGWGLWVSLGWPHQQHESGEGAAPQGGFRSGTSLPLALMVSLDLCGEGPLTCVSEPVGSVLHGMTVPPLYSG